MRTRAGRDISTHRSTQPSDNRNGDARTTRTAQAVERLAPADTELNEVKEHDLEPPVKRLKMQHLVAALSVRQKMPVLTTHLRPAKSHATTGDADVSEIEDEIVSKLVALVRNAALAFHHYGPVRTFLVNNSGICHTVKAETMTMWMHKVMQQLRAGDAAATPIDMSQRTTHATDLNNSANAGINKSIRILPGWPKDVISELTKLVRNAKLPALDSNRVGAYIREVGKGAGDTILERWTRLIMQNLQHNVAGGLIVRDGRDRTSALDLTNQGDDDRISELAAVSKGKSIGLTNDDNENKTDFRHALEGRVRVANRISISEPLLANHTEIKQQSFSEISNAPAQSRYVAQLSLISKKERASRNYESMRDREHENANVGHPYARKGWRGQNHVHCFRRRKGNLRNPPELNITYNLPTGEYISFPVTRSYNLGAMGRYGGGLQPDGS